MKAKVPFPRFRLHSQYETIYPGKFYCEACSTMAANKYKNSIWWKCVACTINQNLRKQNLMKLVNKFSWKCKHKSSSDLPAQGLHQLKRSQKPDCASTWPLCSTVLTGVLLSPRTVLKMYLLIKDASLATIKWLSSCLWRSTAGISLTDINPSCFEFFIKYLFGFCLVVCAITKSAGLIETPFIYTKIKSTFFKRDVIVDLVLLSKRRIFRKRKACRSESG